MVELEQTKESIFRDSDTPDWNCLLYRSHSDAYRRLHGPTYSIQT